MLPLEIREFVAGQINSVSQLEVLLLLRATSERDWTAADVSQTLYTTAEITTGQLVDLATSGLLRQEGGGDVADITFRYAPRDQRLAELVDRTALLYRERPVSVISFIYSAPTEKARSFADAFRIRKGPKSRKDD